MRYVVESANTVLFWLVPVFYSFTIIPKEYVPVYLWNPLAAMVLSLRKILMEGSAPLMSTMFNFTIASVGTLVVGYLIFQRLKSRMYEYL
jgi:ABC-type polysaccharide/polyol phosphate export permease